MKIVQAHSQSIAILFTLIFGILSFYYIKEVNNLGSNEATLLLTKKPSIIDWDKFRLNSGQDSFELVGNDTFHNFYSNSLLQVVEDPKSKPSLYIKGRDQIFPIYLQTRTGALPHFISGTLSRWFNPEFGLNFPPWILSILSLLFTLAIIKKKENLILPFLLVALTSPQMLYYINPFFPDSYASFATFLAILTIFNKAKYKEEYKIIGFLIGLSLYFKLASLILYPALLFLDGKRFLKNFHHVLFGFLPFALFFLITFNWSDLVNLFLWERTLLKGRSFNVDVLKYFLLYFLEPAVSFYNIISLNPEFPKLTRENYLFLSLHGLSFIVFAVTFISKKDLLRIFGFLLLYIASTCLVVSGINEDLMDFMAQGIFILLVLIFMFMRTEKIYDRTCKFLVLFSLLIMSRGIAFYGWHQEIKKYSGNFSECIWAYQCMVEDWKKNDLLKDHQLITVYYLDVGQIEYFSQESIRPLHVNWKYSKKPSPEEFLNFLELYPAKEFFILTSKELGIPTDLTTYLKKDMAQIRKLLGQRKMSIEIIREYNYPYISRQFQLLKISHNLI